MQQGLGSLFKVSATWRFPSFIKLEIVDDFSQKKKNPLQNRKLANAANRRVSEIYRLDNGALELLPISLKYTSMI